ncbi:MAG: hypothetical protein H6907_12130 [Hyphomicrobiales bacterium]|nr:hypothetical protein [Hyphomicrobiales bacterium]MCP5372470.1 hypothetical protein [Hyphomicrobiales bacterium]
MKNTFERDLENLIEKYLANGADAADLVEVLTRQTNLVIGRHNLEFELDRAVGQ